MSTTPNLVIEQGTATDLEEVMTVMDAAFDPCFGEAWTRGQCAGILGLAGIWLLIARVNGMAAGFALTRSVADEAELLLLAVHPAQRRSGIGRALLDTVRHDARARNATRLHLEMREGNPAIHLYAAGRFSEVGRRAKYYRGRDGHVFDAVTLACSLDAD